MDISKLHSEVCRVIDHIGRRARFREGSLHRVQSGQLGGGGGTGDTLKTLKGSSREEVEDWSPVRRAKRITLLKEEPRKRSAKGMRRVQTEKVLLKKRG